MFDHLCLVLNSRFLRLKCPLAIGVIFKLLKKVTINYFISKEKQQLSWVWIIFTLCYSPLLRLRVFVPFCSTLSFKSHMNNFIRSAYFYLCNINLLRPSLSHHATTILVHNLALTHLAYCKSIPSDLPQKSIKKLQLVENSAACIISGIPAFQHITPVFQWFLWFPVKFRITFKLILYTFKAIHDLPYLSDLLSCSPFLRSSSSIRLTVRGFCLITMGSRARELTTTWHPDYWIFSTFQNKTKKKMAQDSLLFVITLFNFTDCFIIYFYCLWLLCFL